MKQWFGKWDASHLLHDVSIDSFVNEILLQWQCIITWCTKLQNPSFFLNGEASIQCAAVKHIQGCCPHIVNPVHPLHLFLSQSQSAVSIVKYISKIPENEGSLLNSTYTNKKCFTFGLIDHTWPPRTNEISPVNAIHQSTMWNPKCCEKQDNVWTDTRYWIKLTFQPK